VKPSHNYLFIMANSFNVGSIGANKQPHTPDDATKMEITINPKDLDISQLTSSVMDLGTHLNTFLMQTFKDAYNKGLKSGYVLGHKQGFNVGKEEGFEIGKKEGSRKGRKEAKYDYIDMLKNIDDDVCDDDTYCKPLITNQLQQMQGNIRQY